MSLPQTPSFQHNQLSLIKKLSRYTRPSHHIFFFLFIFHSYVVHSYGYAQRLTVWGVAAKWQFPVEVYKV